MRFFPSFSFSFRNASSTQAFLAFSAVTSKVPRMLARGCRKVRRNWTSTAAEVLYRCRQWGLSRKH